MERRPRESSNLTGERSRGWSRWMEAMVYEEQNNFIGRGNRIGYKLQNLVVPNGNCCGIYEWRAKRDGQNPIIVYVGSTCREGDSLQQRIEEHCSLNTHKVLLINTALRRGYNLQYRTKSVDFGDNDLVRAQDLENELLDKYDYAWNQRRNGNVRDILPR